MNDNKMPLLKLDNKPEKLQQILIQQARNAGTVQTT